MSLLENLVKPETVLPCRVRTVLAELSDKDRDILQNAINDLTWPAETLANSLRDFGLQVSASKLRAHRKNACSCSKI